MDDFMAVAKFLFPSRGSTHQNYATPPHKLTGQTFKFKVCIPQSLAHTNDDARDRIMHQMCFAKYGLVLGSMG